MSFIKEKGLKFGVSRKELSHLNEFHINWHIPNIDSSEKCHGWIQGSN